MIDQIIDYNKTFVAEKGCEKYITDKYPDKKLAVLSCMDTRLTELLPAALGLKNGDAKIIKNAGGLVISAFDSAMRSLIVASRQQMHLLGELTFQLGQLRGIQFAMKLLSDQCRKYDVTFDFIETGTVFVKGQKTYHISDKRIQSKQAFLSGLSFQGRKVPRLLRMPEGTLFGTDVITPEPFFREHCNTCGSRLTCNGCSNCGACDKNKFIQQIEIQV